MPTRVPALVEMWRDVFRKSYQPMPPAQVHTPVILFHFNGGGAPLVVGQPMMAAVTFPSRVIGCWLFAGDDTLNPVSVTASVDLRRGQQGHWAEGSHPLYGATMPGLSGASEADVSIADWFTELQPGDLLPARLAVFTGSATWLLLVLPLRRLDAVGLGVDELVAGGDSIVTSGGDRVVLRS